jgi:D-glycero-alpha-D-manno-heptose 1-phosphate guanylyltransferase
MIIKEAIVLAGGLGTRIQSVLPGIPKCLAPVAGKPFLDYVINHFRNQGIEKFIFATGYKSEMIEDYLNHHSQIEYLVSKEKEPLGTGGAIKLAAQQASTKNILVLNGDTLFRINVGKLNTLHNLHEAICTLSLKPMKNIDRYGVVELEPDQSIKCFKEKQYYREGLINGGVYALNAEYFLDLNLPEKFSFELDYLGKNTSEVSNENKIYASIQDEYFIDIGIPQDYERAQRELIFKN